MKYTKGEWTAEQTDIHVSIRPWRVLQGTKIICKLDSYDRYNSEANIEEEANAKLIAAAPDLLEALILLNAGFQCEYPEAVFYAGVEVNTERISNNLLYWNKIAAKAIKKATP